MLTKLFCLSNEKSERVWDSNVLASTQRNFINIEVWLTCNENMSTLADVRITGKFKIYFLLRHVKFNSFILFLLHSHVVAIIDSYIH